MGWGMVRKEMSMGGMGDGKERNEYGWDGGW